MLDRIVHGIDNLIGKLIIIGIFAGVSAVIHGVFGGDVTRGALFGMVGGCAVLAPSISQFARFALIIIGYSALDVVFGMSLGKGLLTGTLCILIYLAFAENSVEKDKSSAFENEEDNR